MEERSRSFDRKSSYDYSKDDHGYVKERSFDSSEYRSSGHNLMNNSLNCETKEILKQDRISAMSNEILFHILSFLSTKDAIKTNMLSNKWLRLWNFVPNLHFTCAFLEYEYIREFVTFVDQTLLLHRAFRVNKFIVNFHYNHSLASNVDEWVHFATNANVEELWLLLLGERGCGDNHYDLPQHVYTNSSMTTLKLTWCDVEPNGLIRWKSLKSLLIGCTDLSEDVMQNILVGAPVLESLELYRCCGFFGGFRR